MFRRNAGINGDLRYQFAQRFIAQSVDLRAFHRPCTRLQNADFLGNGRSGYFVIAGDHNRPDSGLHTFGHSVFGFQARRIHHGNQTDKGQAVFLAGIQRTFHLRMPFFVSKSQNAQPVLRKALVGITDGLAVLLCYGP